MKQGFAFAFKRNVKERAPFANKHNHIFARVCKLRWLVRIRASACVCACVRACVLVYLTSSFCNRTRSLTSLHTYANRGGCFDNWVAVQSKIAFRGSVDTPHSNSIVCPAACKNWVTKIYILTKHMGPFGVYHEKVPTPLPLLSDNCYRMFASVTK